MRMSMRAVSLALCFATAAVASIAIAAEENAASATSLRQLHAQSAEALKTSAFGRPLTLQSADDKGTLRGEVLVEIAHPLQRVRAMLEDPAAWCEVMLLTPNMSACAVEQGDGKQLAVRLSRSFDQPAKEAYAASFAFKLITSTPDYSHLQLTADRGPIGTRNYRFDVEALALDDKRSVLRMAYSYSYGLKASLATKAYLATKGSDKVGFTALPDGSKVGGMRGSVERNAMRYYLAIETRTSQSGDGTPASRFESSLDGWLAAIEPYPQLQETDSAAYRAAKLSQFQQSGSAPAS